MAVQIDRPTAGDFAYGRGLFISGALTILAAAAVLIGMRFILGTSPDASRQYVVEGIFCVMSLGAAAALWGLRVYAREAEFNSASRSGLTPAYEAACTMLAILFAAVPVVAGLIAIGVIELPTFPESGG